MVVHWTGIGVIPRTITTAQAAQAKAVFGHDILIWDNYPVNDYLAGRIPLADYSGREPGIAQHVAGAISNPMNQAAVSKLALYSFAELGWNPAKYDEQASWHRAIAERAGGDRMTIAALDVFADLNTYDSTLHPEKAPVLAARTAAFWKTWAAGDQEEAIAALEPYFNAIEKAPAQLRAGVEDPAFADEAKAWLDATVLWGQALRRSLRLLDEVADGNGAAAWASRQRIDALVAQAKDIRDVRLPHSNTYPRIGEGVADAFLAEAGRVHDQWMGIEPGRTASSSQGTYAENVPDRMVDGDESTYFWSNGAPVAGDEIRVDLGTARAIGDVAVLMGKSGSPNDYIHSGVLEYSTDGSSWTELTRATTAEVRFTAAVTARYVRYRAIVDNPSFWLVVREFAVQVTDGSELVLTATGTPAPAEGSSLSDAVDGNVGTAYVAGSAPTASDALTVELSSPTSADRITVLQAEGSAAAGRVEVRTSAGWQDVGPVKQPYSPVQLPATTIEGIRIAWAAGAVQPRVHEVIVHRAGN
ncbi:beta-N-acetylglucosaminidase domain-containing protein [Kribbella sp. NPDC050124]|uniref:beta-N-acetylglucosaminidase domain-containing protein n=1 Tax=Kribbella sp. NPDC050124 TaxID=3364114 RepID=UPI0037B5CA13